MDKFCRGCLVRYEEPTELIHYTEKNRRLFVYSTGLQVKRNDTFTFQLCKDCYLNMKVACNFKKQCRNSDKKFKNYLDMKESGESVDLPTFLKNNDDSWMFRFPAMYGSSTPVYQRPKDEDNESTTTSIRNFITDMMPEADLPDTEARIIREVIEEHDDVLEDSLDSHWLQDDASIDTDFRLDFNFSPFSTPRSINNDRYIPKKLSQNKSTEKNNDHNQNKGATNKILDMPLLNDESNHALLPIKVEREYDQIDQLEAVNDILQNELGERNDDVELPPKLCTIDRNLEEALKNTNNKEFALEDLLASPKVVPGICTPPTPLINNILFGENLDMDENTNESHEYKAGRCIENYQHVEGDVDMLDYKEEIDMKVETTDIMENYTIEIMNDTDGEPLREVDNDFNVTNFYCKMCNKTFKTLKYLKKHSATYHQGKRKETLLICDYCGIQMKDRTNLLRHIQIHMRGPEPNYGCGVCALKFSTKHALQMHERTHLETKDTTSAKTKKHVCTECGASMNKASNLKIHMRRHRKTFAVQCPHCDKGFYRTAELTIHLRYHTGEKPYVCTYCGKGFARHDALTRHVKCHLDIKLFKCDFCKTRFVNSTNLKTHLKKSSNCAKNKERSVREMKSVKGPQTFVTEEIHMKADVACTT